MDASAPAPGPPAPSELPTFIAQLRSVVDIGDLASPGVRAQADLLLTEGCARALALERECLRMRAEAADLAAHVDETSAAQELRMLAPALRSAEQNLRDLRAALDELKASLVPARAGVERHAASETS